MKAKINNRMAFTLKNSAIFISEPWEPMLFKDEASRRGAANRAKTLYSVGCHFDGNKLRWRSRGEGKAEEEGKIGGKAKK